MSHISTKTAMTVIVEGMMFFGGMVKQTTTCNNDHELV
jgi:hypothetical protein